MDKFICDKHKGAEYVVIQIKYDDCTEDGLVCSSCIAEKSHLANMKALKDSGCVVVEEVTFKGVLV